MKKLFAIIAVFVAVFAAFLFGSNIVAVHAEIGNDGATIVAEPVNETEVSAEETAPADQEVEAAPIDSTAAPSGGKEAEATTNTEDNNDAAIAALQKRVDELLEYINSQEEVQWFMNFIGSPLISGAVGAISFLFGLIPWIRKSQRYKALQAAASQMSDDFEDYKKENSVENLKKILVDTVSVEVKKQFDDLLKAINIDTSVLADSNATNKAIYQLLSALVDGAKIAWGGDVEARKALNVQPTAETVKESEETILKLKQYIAKTEGQAAVEKALKG